MRRAQNGFPLYKVPKDIKEKLGGGIKIKYESGIKDKIPTDFWHREGLIQTRQVGFHFWVLVFPTLEWSGWIV